MSAVAVNYCRVEEGSFQPIPPDQISIADATYITSTNLQDALNAITTAAIEYRMDEFGNLRPYYEDTVIGDMDYSAGNVITTTSADLRLHNHSNLADIAFNTGDGETTTIKELKDEIQMLKDEMNNLKMLLLEN